MQTTLAARYARALAEVVSETAALGRVGRELETFGQLLRESRPLRDFFGNPAIPASRKLEMLSQLAKRVKISAPTRRLLEILLRKGRIELVREVEIEFRKIEEKALNRVSVEVTTAVPLAPSERKRVTASLETLTGKSVRLEPRVDPGIIGGARARIGSRVYDGTLSGRLQKLRQKLIGER